MHQYKKNLKEKPLQIQNNILLVPNIYLTITFMKSHIHYKIHSLVVHLTRYQMKKVMRKIVMCLSNLREFTKRRMYAKVKGNSQINRIMKT